MNVSTKQHRSNFFDPARHLAAMLVLFSHHFVLSGQKEPFVPGFESYGGVAVIIFFSISGYLITKSAMRSNGFIDYSSKRLRRIIPALIPCAIFTHLIVGSLSTNLDLITYLNTHVIDNVIKTITFNSIPNDGFSSNYIHRGSNGSLWTLPLELACYAVIAFVMCTSLSLKSMVISFTIMLFLSAYVVITKNQVLVFSIPIWLYPLRAMVFMLGGILALTQDKWNKKSVIIPILSMLLIYSIGVYGKRIEYFTTMYILIAFATISLCINIKDPFIKGRFDLSYGIYIYAFPVQQLVINVIGASFYIGMLISAVITIALATASWFLIEKRFLR